MSEYRFVRLALILGVAALGTRLLVSCGGASAHALGKQPLLVASTPFEEPEAAPVPEPAPEPAPPDLIASEDDSIDDSPLRNVQQVVLSPFAAEVTWETASYADSEVRYGTSKSLGASPVVYKKKERYHTVLLSGLKPGTKYYLKVSSTLNGKRTSSDIFSFTTMREWSFSVRRDHPRIFVTSETLPDLKRQVQSSHSASWNKLIKHCDGLLSKTAATALSKNADAAGNMRGMALAALLTGKSAYVSKAEAFTLHAAALDPGKIHRRARQAYMEGMGCTYDWLYDRLSSTTRSKLQAGIAKYMRGFANSDKDNVFGHAWENVQSVMQAGLAIYGENSEATKIINSNVKRFQNRFLPTWRHFSRDGGSHMEYWYCSFTLEQVLRTAQAFYTASDLHLFETEANWLGTLPAWYCWGLRGDASYPRAGDAKTFVGINSADKAVVSLIARHFKHPQAQWFAEMIEGETGLSYGPDLYNDILFFDRGVRAEEVAGGSKSRLFLPTGTVYVRDRWDERSVLAKFRSTPHYFMGHQHLDSNSFSIYYKGGQALDSGKYTDYGDDHHVNYYTRTIAHNSILLHDPDEKFVRFSKTYANDGGQHWLVPGRDSATSRPYHVTDLLNPSKGFRVGGIDCYEDTDDYTYALGDATRAYSPHKMGAFQRHFLFLKNVDGFKKPVIVLFDRVVAKSKGFKKTYLLHTQKAPTLKGKSLHATNQGGMLFQQTLFPEDAVLSVVGGSGKEFWSGGRNRPTKRDPSKFDEAGKYRVEVSPGSARATDYFLHVLHATDAGSSWPPSGKGITSSSFKGVDIGNWVVLFPKTMDELTSASYSIASAEQRFHLLVGLAPLTSYEVLLDGKKVGEVASTFNGTVHFETTDAVEVELRASR